MSYDCISTGIPDAPDGFMAMRQRVSALQGSQLEPFFAINGNGFIMTINRNLPMSWRFTDEQGFVDPQGYDFLRIEFADDLDWVTSVVASQDFPVVYPETEDESYGGIFPLSEFNKLTVESWYVAKLSASDAQEIALCPFYVQGGV